MLGFDSIICIPEVTVPVVYLTSSQSGACLCGSDR